MLCVKDDQPLSPVRHLEPRGAGFSLIELLTAIAVVAVLATIVISVIRSVAVKSEESRCASNIRQLQLANVLYASENNGMHVPVFYTDENKVGTNWYSISEFRKMLDVPSNLNQIELPDNIRCPLAVKLDVKRGYGYNCTGLGGSFSEANSVRAVYQAQIARPSESIAFIDGLDWQVRWTGASNYPGMENERNMGGGIPSYRHNNHAYVAFWDAHVERVSADRLSSDRSMWDIID